MGHDGEACPAANGNDDSTVYFGDVGGLFSHKVRWCYCMKADNDRWQQLMCLDYMPATLSRPQTAFTFRLLDRIHLEQTECESAMDAIYRVLERLTDPDNQDRVDNRYIELSRVKRCYRDMSFILEGGGFHEPDLMDTPGGLAYFCSDCAQPGVNVFERKDGDTDEMYTISLVMDGNFKLQGQKTRNPQDDVQLRRGTGLMTDNDEYKRFLGKTKTHVQKRMTCYQAEDDRQKSRPTDHLLWGGLASIACSRHGCFFPNASMNIRRAEQHRIFDFGMANICHWVEKVLNSATVPENVKIRHLNAIYDRGCQYSVHFPARMQEFGFELPTDVKIAFFIGKFHLGVHQADCWAMYTLDLMLGAGRQDGEILETLWAGLNKSKGTVHALSEAHRQEFLDDLLQDSNFRKLINGGKQSQ
ncbi:hypothetical protein K435DRAFT_663020 [Dendrothele bispora CBS 962.96]|uniref:CxC2-like cysteine cluster KDZ transposase-associated domain-containing protein n=1 Tax=Dendrothele bispora (strain CBS 962.96) TaxID=1314807 RepID=A0A4S8M4V4_DENBC|nr:hypothetical protein K435DRAFT_663020 [Dendrothele bispora CBS 962.96]